MTALNSDGPRPPRGAGLTASVAAVLVLISGCSPAADQPSDTVSSSGSAQQSESVNPVVAGPASDALAAVTETRLLVEEMANLHLGLRPQAARMATLHLAHEGLLQELSGATPSPSPEPSRQPTVSRRQAERTLATAESRLSATLADLAVAAEDGPLARALASMSAGTSQTATSVGWGTDLTPTSPMPQTSTLGADESLAVQRVLGREHASLWWYGALGGRTSAAEQPGFFEQLSLGYEAHRRQRDQLTALLSGQGVTPVAAEPSYPIDWNLRSGRENVKQTHQIGHESAAAYSWLVSKLTGDRRKWAVVALRNAAIRDLAVQGTPENFPGADELADH